MSAAEFCIDVSLIALGVGLIAAGILGLVFKTAGKARRGETIICNCYRSAMHHE